MNKTHLLAVLLATVLVLPAIAQKKPTPATVVSAISLTSFQKLIINTNVDIVLVQDNTLKQAIIEGDAPMVNNMVLFIAREVMTVSAKNSPQNGKIKLTIPVDRLSWLEINADAQIVSQNVLASPRLAVFVNGNCGVNLRSAGKITVTGIDGHEVIYAKR